MVLAKIRQAIGSHAPHAAVFATVDVKIFDKGRRLHVVDINSIGVEKRLRGELGLIGKALLPVRVDELACAITRKEHAAGSRSG